MVIIFRCETPLGAITSLACGPVDIASGEPGEIPDVVGTEWFAKVHCDKETVIALSLEIADIERRWLDEE